MIKFNPTEQKERIMNHLLKELSDAMLDETLTAKSVRPSADAVLLVPSQSTLSLYKNLDHLCSRLYNLTVKLILLILIKTIQNFELTNPKIYKRYQTFHPHVT